MFCHRDTCLVLYILLLFATLQATIMAEAPPHSIKPSTVYLTSDRKRIRGFSNKDDVDIVVGAVFPVHNSHGTGVCQPDQVFAETTDYMEAVLYAIDSINADPTLLPNVTLGYDLRDSCITENIALEETVDMIISSRNDEEACKIAGGNISTTSSPVASVVIGDYASSISIPIASFLRVFSVPQVSVATSVLLNNRERFRYFYRTVPSDDQQTEAIIDLVLHFGWTYVSTLHSNDLYGEPGIDNFRTLANQKGICIDLDEGIDEDFTPEQYTDLARKVYNSSAEVIVFFSSFNQVNGLMNYLLKLHDTIGKERKFLWIAGDTWADSAIVFSSEYEPLIRGMWGIVPKTTNHLGFEEYFSSLTVSNNKRNEWYREYHEYYYNCTSNLTCNDSLSIGNNKDYKTNAFTPFVIDAVYSFAHALNDFLDANCEHPITWDPIEQSCEGQRISLNGSTLRSYLERVNFTSITSNPVVFDKTGSIEGTYAFFNYQFDSNTNTYTNVPTAMWDMKSPVNERLVIFPNIIHQFGVDEFGEPVRALESQCTNCPLGKVFRPVQGSCCGTCSPCLGSNFSNMTDSSTECSTCPLNTWGKTPLNGSSSCESIKETYLSYSDAWGIILITVGLIGMLAVVIVTIGLIALWNKSVIKSSGREQMVLLLIGIACCFLSTIFYILKPSIPVCLFQRVFTWVSFALILSALFIKLVRIARIFLRGNKSRRPPFIQPGYQILFTFMLVGFQVVLVTISLVIVYPETTNSILLNSKDTNDYPTLVLRCAPTHVIMIGVQMLFFAILLISSNALAMITIRFPANFNEVRYVAFCTFAIGLIWLTFIIAFFATTDEFRGAILSFAIQLSALTVLVSMFVTRLCVQLCFPNQVQSGTDGNPSIILTRERRTSSVGILNGEQAFIKRESVSGSGGGTNEGVATRRESTTNGSIDDPSLKVRSPVTVTFSVSNLNV